jgi:hypothetical protein
VFLLSLFKFSVIWSLRLKIPVLILHFPIWKKITKIQKSVYSSAEEGWLG